MLYHYLISKKILKEYIFFNNFNVSFFILFYLFLFRWIILVVEQPILIIILKIIICKLIHQILTTVHRKVGSLEIKPESAYLKIGEMKVEVQAI